MYFSEIFENNSDTYPYQCRVFNLTDEFVDWYYNVPNVYYFNCFQFHMVPKNNSNKGAYILNLSDQGVMLLKLRWAEAMQHG